MRIIWVWIWATILIFTVTVGWLLSLPVIAAMGSAANSTVYGNPDAVNVVRFVEYAGYAWGPAFIGFILLLAVLNSQRRDVESEIYA